MQAAQILASQFAQDARYAFRWFRRESVLTGAIVLTLAFGVGLNAGVFSVLSGMVFRSRVETDPASFFQLLQNSPSRPGAGPRLFSSSTAEFTVYRSAPHLNSVAAWAVSSGRVGEDANPTLLLMVSCEFFPLYGLKKPLAGRLFEGDECTASRAAPAVIVSEQLWRARYRSSPTLIGQKIEINRAAYTVVGIAPADFSGRLRGPGIWIPYTQQAAFYGGVDLFTQASIPWLTVEGRIAAGHSRNQIASELRTLSPASQLALTNGSLFEDPSNRMLAGSVSLLLTGALGLILLLACTNVASLLLARAVSRRYETSVRLSMGASPARLLRMAATEGILLSLLSGGVSAAIAAALPATFQRLVPQMPHYPVHTDWIVFAYLAGVTLLAGCVASLAPAAESLRTNLSGSLKHEQSRRLRLREVLVAAQAALSLALMIGAALFARTERRIVDFTPGFDARSVLLAPVSRTSLSRGFSEVQAQLAALEGVRSVAFTSSLFWSRAEETQVTLAGGGTAAVAISGVSPEFFATLGIAMGHGDTISASRADAVVVTEAGAKLLWSGRDAIGQRFDTPDGMHWVVAGVARASDLDGRSPVPRIFRAISPAAFNATALVRFRGDSGAASRDVTRVLDAAGLTARELPRTIEADMGEIGNRFGVMAGFATFFGASAFVLALVGLYGVIAFFVGRRTKEMGIRLALGASRADIVRDVLLSGLKPVLWGLAVGLPIAGALAAALGFAFRNTPTPFHAGDPFAFAVMPLVLIAGAAAAILKPALRASSADPSTSLRHD